jgi:hypothetical protein
LPVDFLIPLLLTLALPHPFFRNRNARLSLNSSTEEIRL